MGRIFCLVGKSATGKDTILRRIAADCPQLRTVVRYTTRPKREGETEGVEYRFTTSEAIADLEKQGKVIEQITYNTVAGPWTYATVDDGGIDPDSASYLTIATPESCMRLRERFGAGKVVPLYVFVDEETRYRRAVRREWSHGKPDFAEMERRFTADASDFSEEKLEQCGIGKKRFRNYNLDTCVGKIEAAIRAAEKE